MKTKAVLLIGAILLILSVDHLTIAQQPRGAIWVHGLGDDSRQWRVWRNLFDF